MEAAVDLHGSVGPVLSTFSMVAEWTGGRSHTLYAHFADKRSLMLAGGAGPGTPQPDAEAWHATEGRKNDYAPDLVRLRLVRAKHRPGRVRAAEYHTLRREIIELAVWTAYGAWHEVIGSKLSTRQYALL